MRKLDLKDWAALGELVATVAVVVSLIFVVISVDQNTDALQGVNDNALFERHDNFMRIFVEDASMAAILAKKRRGEEPLSDVEAVRWERYRLSLADIWVMAFLRHERGLLDDGHWEAWDLYFRDLFSNQAEAFTKSEWAKLRYGYDEHFWEHVDAALFGADSKDLQTSER
jgi:hypothetical protein